MKFKDCYNNAEEFFDLLKEMTLLRIESSFIINCDFILYFILLETENLPHNYNLFIENIKNCYITSFKDGLVDLVFNSTQSSYSFKLFSSNFKNYIEKGFDFRVIGNEQAILAINKESALYRLNELRLRNINGLLKDIKNVEEYFSNNIKEILKS